MIKITSTIVHVQGSLSKKAMIKFLIFLLHVHIHVLMLCKNFELILIKIEFYL